MTPSRIRGGDGPGDMASVTIQHGTTTYLRCAGCGTATMFGHRDPEYGRLVRDFLDRHGQCGKAVEISAARQQASPAVHH